MPVEHRGLCTGVGAACTDHCATHTTASNSQSIYTYVGGEGPDAVDEQDVGHRRGEVGGQVGVVVAAVKELGHAGSHLLGGGCPGGGVCLAESGDRGLEAGQELRLDAAAVVPVVAVVGVVGGAPAVAVVVVGGGDGGLQVLGDDQGVLLHHQGREVAGVKRLRRQGGEVMAGRGAVVVAAAAAAASSPKHEPCILKSLQAEL